MQCLLQSSQVMDQAAIALILQLIIKGDMLIWEQVQPYYSN